MRFVILAFPLALIGCGTSVASEGPKIPPDKAKLTMQAAVGPVSFEHQAHADLEGSTCQSCHHKTEVGATPAACGTCHTKDSKPNRADAMHGSCVGCHDKTEGKTGPTSAECMACHVQPTK